MHTIHPSAIKEIAEAIAIGNTCYAHKYSRKITTIDNSADDIDVLATQEKTQAEIEHKIDDYLKIEQPSTEDQLVMMEYFLEEISDKSVRKQLSNALKRDNPVRNFMQTVTSNMELQIHWEYFNAKEYERWVSNLIIDAYNF
jgi:hypothetical protein